MSDLSMLRWRIEEQSEVIMRLKEELDESTSRLKDQEKINEETSNVNTILQTELGNGEEKLDSLEKEIKKVFVEFDELVKTKEKLKSKNENLQKEILKIEKENKDCISAVVEEKSRIVQEKNKLIASAQVLLAKLDTEYSQLVVLNGADVLNQENELLEMIHTRTKAELEKMMKDTESELSVTMKHLEGIRSNRKKLSTERKELTKRYEEENEIMLSSLEDATENIKKEKEHQVQLKEQEENLQKDLAVAEGRYKDEEYLINSESLIKRLTEDLSKINSSSEKALKEFSAFQTHTENLIQREKKLNERFQMLSS